MINAPSEAPANTYHDSGARYSYCCNQSFIKYHDKGTAMTHEITTSEAKSPDNILHNLPTEAPNTFRMLISFALCSATKEASPKIPRQLMKTASPANINANFPVSSSSLNL